MKWTLLIRVILGLYSGYIGIMDKNIETTMAYWGVVRNNAKEIETTIA